MINQSRLRSRSQISLLSARSKQQPTNAASPSELKNLILKAGMNFKTYNLNVLENLLKQKTVPRLNSFSILKISEPKISYKEIELKPRDGLRTLKNIEKFRCGFSFGKQKVSKRLPIISTQFQQLKRMKSALLPRLMSKDLQLFQQEYKHWHTHSLSPKLRLFANMDLIVIYDYNGKVLGRINYLLELTNKLILIQLYPSAQKVLKKSLALAMQFSLLDKQLQIYDKLGLVYYYLQKLHQSKRYHQLFSQGKAISKRVRLPDPPPKEAFTNKFIGQLSTPLFNEEYRANQYLQILNQFLKGLQTAALIPDESIQEEYRPSMPVGFKSHLSGNRMQSYLRRFSK